MAQKRKVEVIVDENDRGLYSFFQNTANNVTQLYSQSLSYQKIAFDAGQRHALEKLNEWMAMKQQEGKLLTVADIIPYLQEQLNNSELSSQLQELCGNGSHQIGASQNVQMEPGASSSAPLMQGQDTDMEMDIASEDPNH
ncbi:hypothetical protein F0562_001286 [Nyssa sinensis]|uniref:Uncharacterized protein n=1 Tax=Nyssa sinensis TaxID=561372 RepID=A0A5J5C410_9ASTE|nr:hypothetical protein F0562_001286 [Nyssa sinensis]